MKSGLKNLPPVVQELVDHIGLPSTIELINQFGGTTINIPMGGTSVGTAALVRLAAVIGEEAAEKLSKICFGEPIYIPKCEKYLRDTRNQNINQTFIEQVRHGKKANSVVAELAREYRLSDRWVW
ncbi:MAG: Mor transcription activator family protein, partial [Pseudomonadales bacterium]